MFPDADKSAVEVSEAQEGLDFLFVGWCQPLLDTHYFDWVHGNRVIGDDHSEVLHCGLLELTLLWFQVELVSFYQFQDMACY